MKKILTIAVSVLLIATSAFAAGKKKDSKKSNLRVGMVTDSGTIDDKSFNQGTWEGILRAQKDMGIKTKYLKPAGTTEAEKHKKIGNLADAGYQMIICTGFKFESAV